MGQIENFTISFQKPDAIYFSGERLIGKISLRVLKSFKIKCIKMMIKGDARVVWSERKNKHTHSYSSNESYLNFDCVFVTKESKSDLYLEPGDYSYPFDVVIPDNAPTSFEHVFGNVRYSVYCTIDIPWKFDKHVIRSFSVINPLDLNLNSNLRNPYATTDTKVVCCGPFKNAPITTTFSVLKGK